MTLRQGRRIGKAAPVAALAIAASVLVTAAVLASHGSADHSPNLTLLGNYSEGGAYRNGTDLAFWGNTAIAGALDQGTGGGTSPVGTSRQAGFRVLDISTPAAPRLLGKFECVGDDQSDVSIWGDLVIVSVDKPTFENCKDGAATWEGIRIVSIADPARPVLLDTVETACGSHTNTIYVDEPNKRLLVYVLSYPLAGRYNPAGATPTCNAQSHRKLSVVEVPLNDPAAAKVIATPTTGETIGCHDVTLFLDRKLAGAACLTESQLWDISTPAEPKIVARIRDPNVNIHHSTAFSWDGNVLVIGDELGGAAASPGCFSDRSTYGGLFFYDVSDPRAPVRKGAFKIPQRSTTLFCTAHLFNTIPLRSDSDILVSSWYTGATSVIDFTDPAAPKQVAHYIPNETTSPDQQPTEAAAWSSYWYNGHIYSNNFDEDVNSASPRSRGFDVFRLELPELAQEVRLPRLNPQVQEPLPPLPRPPAGGQGLRGPTFGASRLLISRRTARMTSRGLIPVRVLCRGGRTCDGVLTLRLARQFRRGEREVPSTLLGRASFGVPARGRAVVRVRVPRKKQRLLGRLGGAHVVATATTRRLAGQRRVTTAKLYVKRTARYKGRR